MLIKEKKNHQEAIIILNIYAPNTGVDNYIKEILLNLKPHVNYNTVIAGDLNTRLINKQVIWEEIKQRNSGVKEHH